MLTELKTRLVARIGADPALGALLASPDGVYQRRPPKGVELPCLTFSLEERPDPDPSRIGRSTVEVRLDIWSASADTNDAILAALDDLLGDGHRSGAMDGEAFRVAACRRAWSREAADEDLRQADGAPLRLTETLWRLIVIATDE